MDQLPDDRAEVVFEDYKPAYTMAQALAEANRCLYCAHPPCVSACPTSIDIPTFIRRIADENPLGSAQTIFDANILGMSCARVCPVEVLCVGDCVYNAMGVPPIQIGKLQRYATDLAFERGERFFEAGEDTGKRVALVGAGPASLAAAHELRRFGHSVTIFERDDHLGGLNTTGVAPYKMKADRALEEAAWILGIGGVEVRSNVNVPGDVSWAELEEGFDAVFIGFGLGPDRLLDLPNADASGIHGAVDFIAQMKLEAVDLSHVKRAVVLGGGNTALDCVRELPGLGVAEVSMVYRGDEASMSGYAHEWAVAKQLGVRGAWRLQPVGFVAGDAGQVTGVRCQPLGADKRPLAGAEEVVIAADLVLLAIGQSRLGDLAAALDGVEVEWGRILTDEHGATGRPGVWAGGDCANGGKEVVNAAAEGKAAARSIHAHLTGGPHA